jgi:exoribonuclease R
MARAEDARGAAVVSPPDQELERDADGNYALHVRPWRPSEIANSALSLAANIAIAEALQAAGTGMFRVMPPPDDRAIARLRLTARALGLEWPDNATFAQFNRTVDPCTQAGAAFAYAVRRATGHAGYVPFTPGKVPWHAALGATYTHATAPMRRLADRYVLDAALALARGLSPGPEDAALFARLSMAMDTADSREGAIERAVLDLAETVILVGREGDVFTATVTERDEKGARIQLNDLPILARVDADHIAAGDVLRIRLTKADPQRRELRFERVG